MATIPVNDLTVIRRSLGRDVTISYIKSEVNLVVQAVEDWFDKAAVKTSLNTDIEAAVPGVFSTLQKKKIVKYWLQNRFGRE